MPLGVAAIDSGRVAGYPPVSGPRSSTRVGDILRGSYRVLRPLDAGGMAVVYEAEHLRLGRRLAIKFLSRELSADAAMAERFRREAEVLARLSHPHIVEVLDFDTSERGEPYLVMELLRGRTLAARLEQDPVIELAEVVTVATQLAEGLSAAHQASIVHRDLKPANVFLEAILGQATRVKLLDFGISKSASGRGCLTREHVVLGTPEYMAPEQAAASRLVDHRADQYSLAAIVYEMLAGQPPFPGDDDIGALLRRVVFEHPPPLCELVPAASAISPVVMRGMAKQPDQRYSSVREFAEALSTAVSAQQNRPLPRRAVPIGRISTGDAPTLAVQVERLGSSAKRALDRGDLGEAALLAESAIDLEKAAADPQMAPAVARISELLERILVERLGGASRLLRAVRSGAGQPLAQLTPRQAYLLSRVDDGLTLDETLDVSALPRLETLRLLTGLLRSGALAAD